MLRTLRRFGAFFVAFAMVASAHAVDFTAQGGPALHSTPPAGTWWEPAYPHGVTSLSAAWGIGLRGDQWSVAYEDLGTQKSSAVACAWNEPACTSGRVSTNHWYGTERPRGVWGAWEPHYGSLFIQIGGGVYWPSFRMVMPDYPTMPRINACAPYCAVGNEHWTPGWLGGIGARFGRFDLIFNLRRTQTNTGGGRYVGLSRETGMLSIRAGF